MRFIYPKTKDTVL